MFSTRLLQNIPIQRRLIVTEEIMNQTVEQIKSTYTVTDCIHETLAKLWIRGNIRALKLTDTDVELEFTCDEDGINLFIINIHNNPAKLSMRGSGRTRIHLKGISQPLEGHYAFHDGAMFTHFRFTPTRDGVLTLLKLVDVSVESFKKPR